LHELSKVMQGSTQNPNTRSQTALFTLNPNGSSSKYLVAGDSEFPRVYDHLVGQRNRLLFNLSATNSHIWSDTVSCLNIDTGKKDTYVYGEDYLVEEHISVSPTKKEGEGYLVGTALHVPSKRTCLNIFAVNKLTNGPVCRAWLPYHIPLGFHGNFKVS
jgi:carotenoid cleavage dioxygenase